MGGHKRLSCNQARSNVRVAHTGGVPYVGQLIATTDDTNAAQHELLKVHPLDVLPGACVLGNVLKGPRLASIARA